MTIAPDVRIDKAAALGDILAAGTQATVQAALSARGRCSLVLTGGSVAEVYFPRLAQLDLDWSRVDFYWGDERAVPPADPQSNYGVAERVWLKPAAVSATNVHRMRGEAADLDAVAREYAAALPLPLDLVLLGVGPDGHVCSLFPGHPLLDARSAAAVIRDSPKPPPVRLTLTLPPLLAARRIVVIAPGAAKADVMAEALQDPQSTLPIAQVIRGASGNVQVLLDHESAQALRR